MTNTNEIFNMPFDQLVNQYASADVTPAVAPTPAPTTQDFVVPASALPENVTGTAPVGQSFDDILKQAGVTNAQIAQPVAQPAPQPVAQPAIQVQPGMTIGDVAQAMNQQPIPAVTMADGSQVVDPFGAVVTTQPSVPTTFEQPATPVETVPAQIVAPFAETADLPIQAQPVEAQPVEVQPAVEVPVVEVQPVAETQPIADVQPVVEAVEVPTEEPAKKPKRARKSKAKAKVDAPVVDTPTVEVPVEVPTVVPTTDDAFLDAETVAQIRAEIRQVVRHEVKAAIVEAFNEFSKVFGSGC